MVAMAKPTLTISANKALADALGLPPCAVTPEPVSLKNISLALDCDPCERAILGKILELQARCRRSATEAAWRQRDKARDIEAALRAKVQRLEAERADINLVDCLRDILGFHPESVVVEGPAPQRLDLSSCRNGFYIESALREATEWTHGPARPLAYRAKVVLSAKA